MYHKYAIQITVETFWSQMPLFDFKHSSSDISKIPSIVLCIAFLQIRMVVDSYNNNYDTYPPPFHDLYCTTAQGLSLK